MAAYASLLHNSVVSQHFLHILMQGRRAYRVGVVVHRHIKSDKLLHFTTQRFFDNAFVFLGHFGMIGNAFGSLGNHVVLFGKNALIYLLHVRQQRSHHWYQGLGFGLPGL